ncbi:MAG: PQQ-dependent sugar dehydrogenase [Chloroflexi bacterium]|nr:PQQ-dependent sugar dehydrogenase [Chloroflexota bacterium]
MAHSAFARTTLTASAAVLAMLGVLAIAPSSPDRSLAGSGIQGDVDCSGDIDAHDALGVIRLVADVLPVAGCATTSGDVNCDSVVDEADALALLFHVGGITATQPAGEGCAAIGNLLIAPTATATEAPATPSSTPTATPSDTPLPSDAPETDGYHLAPVITGDDLEPARQYKVELALIPGVPDEALVVLQTGLIYRVSLDGSFPPQPWGDLSSLVNFDNNEEGLLSVAFSPDFAEDGTVFAYYTPGAPEDTVLARFEATATDLDESSRETVISIEEHDKVHQGGHIIFDDAGYLMLSLGDGGFSGDALEAAQELDRLLGKVIRIDVSEQPYAIPPDNPFVGVAGAREEIFALGFRNPWRMTIDSLTGDVWLGDVGEGSWEEVDHVVAGGNYGWDCFEGFAVWEDDEQCEGKDFIDPRAVYGHDKGLAVVGGFVYRGDEMPELYGWFVYADYATGRVWAVDTTDDSDPVQLTDETFFISSFAQLPNGELLIVSYTDGIYQLVRD